MKSNLVINPISHQGMEFPSDAKYKMPQNEGIPGYLSGIDKINIFLGENNAGKSRLLRGIMQQSKFSMVDININTTLHKNINSVLSEILDKFPSDFYMNIPGQTVGQIFSQKQQWYKDNLHKAAAAHHTINKSLFSQISQLSSAYFSQVKDGTITEKISEELHTAYYVLIILHKTAEVFPEKWAEGTNYWIQDFAKIHPIYKEIAKLSSLIYKLINKEHHIIADAKTIYIPILRSARTLYEIDSLKRVNGDIFSHTIRMQYRIRKEISIHSGMAMYSAIKYARNERRKIRKRFEQFEKFLQVTFFANKDVEIVARHVNNEEEEHINVYIDGQERDIHELGDGIQALIIILYPIFTAEDGSWIFIEEPELNLHPGMQRVLLETLAAHPDLTKKKLRYFITTHSNHIINLSIDYNQQTSVYIFSQLRNEDGKSIHEVTRAETQDLNALQALGVLNSSVLLANCTIWVEGITDRKYLRRYLDAYLEHHHPGRRILEDINYAFLEYAGANVRHYSFAASARELGQQLNGLSISNRVMLVADADSGKDTLHESFIMQQNPRFEYCKLPVREIENLLSADILRAALPSLLQRQQIPVQNLVLDTDLLKSRYLGRYLATQLEAIGVSVGDSFTADSGTLSNYYKTKLPDVAIPHIKWSNMTTEARNVAHQVYMFVVRHNPGIL